MAFGGLGLAFHEPLARFWPQLYDVEYGNKREHLRALVAHKPAGRPLVLAVGSSLTAMALRPAVLEDDPDENGTTPVVYNYALDSAGIVPNLMCVRRLLAEGIRPDWVLIEAWPPFFFTSETTDPKRVLQWPVARVMREDLPVLARYHWNPHQLRQDWRALQYCPAATLPVPAGLQPIEEV